MSAKVSVVIPVFNRPATVHRAIESVLAQTCQDFEIIVVDDGSTDDTPSAVEAFGDPRITLIRHDRNRGGSAARNAGIQASSAPYVAFLDSDDEWLPTKLERQLEVFGRSADRPGLVYTGVERILTDGSVAREMPRKRDRLAEKLLIENVVGGTSVGMVRRRVFDEIGGFDEALPAAQDVDLWVRICERYPVDFVPEILVRIWQRNDGGRISVNLAATINGRELFYQKYKQKLVRHRVLHVYLRESGWLHHRYAGNLRLARSFYLKSIGARPLVPSSYALLLLAYLPISWLDRLARCKHLLTGFVRSVRETCFVDTEPRRATTANVQTRPTRDSAAS